MSVRLFAVTFLTALLWALPAAAQSSSVPSTQLAPYEEQRYGSKLWEVPREPYRTDFEQYKARTYIPPEDDQPARPSSTERRRSSGSGSSPIKTDPGGLKKSDAAVKQRFQTDMKFRESQRKISERSRIPAPSVPTQHRVYGPGQSPALNSK